MEHPVRVDRTSMSPRELPPFSGAEFAHRVERARTLMTAQRLDGVMVTSEANMEYLSGFVTQFAWNSQTRPWYFVLPRTGQATAVIPELGVTNWLATSWCRRIVTWPSPTPENEGLDLLAAAAGRMRRRFGRIGVELGAESRLGMPAGDLLRLRDAIRPMEMADAVPLMGELRLIKSRAEIARLRHICHLAGETFRRLPGLIHIGDSEKTICRKFAADLLLRGADKVPYTSIGTGGGGYTSIMGPTDRHLRRGDILLLDTGAKYAGYFCDFDRNVSAGEPRAEAKRIHDVLWRATEAGIRAAVPGNTASDVFRAQAKVLEDAGVPLGNVGRFGHGLGKAMTEPPSVHPDDLTVLRPGAVVTIEPSAAYGRGKILVHEEDVVVTENGPELLSPRAPREMWRVRT
jgi:Xaa-Pro dipeptidase